MCKILIVSTEKRMNSLLLTVVGLPACQPLEFVTQQAEQRLPTDKKQILSCDDLLII